ncbi:hypothetical protein [Desulfovibrio aminophilus]|uniref:hypothetical protein n=1 Tax=Desulfovibrio aminophilus TaxID=81425 RepID=UPI003394FC01
MKQTQRTVCWVEAVTLRVFDAEKRDDLSYFLEQTLDAVREPGLTACRVCVEATLPTDVSAFLFWEGPGPAGRSRIGQHLASLLREYGLIHHSVWLQRKTEAGA